MCGREGPVFVFVMGEGPVFVCVVEGMTGLRVCGWGKDRFSCVLLGEGPVFVCMVYGRTGFREMWMWEGPVFVCAVDEDYGVRFGEGNVGVVRGPVGVWPVFMYVRWGYVQYPYV